MKLKNTLTIFSLITIIPYGDLLATTNAVPLTQSKTGTSNTVQPNQDTVVGQKSASNPQSASDYESFNYKRGTVDVKPKNRERRDSMGVIPESSTLSIEAWEQTKEEQDNQPHQRSDRTGPDPLPNEDR